MQLLGALEMASSPGNCHGDSSPYSLNPEDGPAGADQANIVLDYLQAIDRAQSEEARAGFAAVLPAGLMLMVTASAPASLRRTGTRAFTRSLLRRLSPIDRTPPNPSIDRTEKESR